MAAYDSCFPALVSNTWCSIKTQLLEITQRYKLPKWKAYSVGQVSDIDETDFDLEFLLNGLKKLRPFPVQCVTSSRTISLKRLNHWKSPFSYKDRAIRLCGTMIQHNDTSGLYYKHITLINDARSIVCKWYSKLWHHWWWQLTTLVKAKAKFGA